MGKSSTIGGDEAVRVTEGTLATSGASPTFEASGRFNVTVWDAGDLGTVSINIERSFDGGANWRVCTAAGETVTFTGEFTEVLDEPEAGVLYRLNIELAEGTLGYRFSQ